MPEPFSEDQIARIRQIVREELAAIDRALADSVLHEIQERTTGYIDVVMGGQVIRRLVQPEAPTAPQSAHAQTTPHSDSADT